MTCRYHPGLKFYTHSEPEFPNLTWRSTERGASLTMKPVVGLLSANEISNDRLFMRW